METAPAKTVLFATREQYIEVIKAHGLKFTEQSGFLKLSSPGGTLYIAATKTVRRVDLSGFTMDLNEQLTKTPHCGEFGNVKQQMVVGTGPEGDIERFAEVMVFMHTLPAPAPKVKAIRVKKVKVVATPPKVEVTVFNRIDMMKAASKRIQVSAAE